MKIAFIASPHGVIPPEKYGGSEAWADCMVRALHRAGHDVTLIAITGSTSPVPSRLIKPGTEVFAGHLPHEYAFVLQAYEGIQEFDVVHENTGVGPLYARAFPGPAYVTTNHGPFEADLNTLYNHVSEWFEVVAISHSQAANAQVPTTVIHHGVDIDRFAFGEGKGDDKGEYLLFLGRMQAIKGPHVAARVAKAAGKRLLIAARMQEDAEFEFFHREVEPLLDENIEYIGEVGGEHKSQLIRNATALLNPIDWPEPFGLVMAEALASGTPAIVTPCGAAPEIVEHGVTGFVCDTEESLIEACRNIDAIDRNACRASAESYFNIDRMAADYVKVYEKAIAKQQQRANTALDVDLDLIALEAQDVPFLHNGK